MARVKFYNAETGAWEYADRAMLVAPVQSVSGKTGAVVLTAGDVGAEPEGAIDAHNADAAAHADIRAEVTALEGRAMLKSDISIQKAQLTLEDGSVVLIDVVVASEGTTILRYTNQIPISIDTDGSIYNGVGYLEGYRLSSSGGIKETGSIGFVTGFIPAKPGDTIHLAGFPFFRSNEANAADGAGNYLNAYDASFNMLGAVTGNLVYYGTWTDSAALRPVCTYTVPSDQTWTTEETTIKLNSVEEIAYVRVSCFSGIASEPDADATASIVTVNEQIA